ncbi:MAG: hypothetical protein KKD56_06850 [Acidobacteria bacterium]|nr:hypothetical protein [Acidobacteriota bacterium]MBU1338767.1 hypothetical protein [Acidobacteriota bacterium]MBU1474587.1 hypothetical protein [Acidobacteriota bacterium]MBU2438453.1 hypothetical protein [Acidobacteriota bacterium]MBU4253257.1 hypothetical protein [Acidobacteriota bacterium]
MTDYHSLNIHQKMRILIQEMVDKELPLDDALCEFRKLYISAASAKYNGVKIRIAEALGIHRNTLNHLVNKLKIK